MLQILLILLIFGCAIALQRAIPFLSQIGVPAALLAGIIALILGPGAADLLPFDKTFLEEIVYHGLAIVFITIALQGRPKAKGGAGAVSFAFAIPSMAALQGAIGLSIVVLMATVTSEPVHPGYGALLPLGFLQGPGQALALGRAWESSGLADGGQVGLSIAAIGFVWAIILGVPLVAWARRRQRRQRTSAPHAHARHTSSEAPARLGLAQFVGNAVLVAAVYGVTILVVHLLTVALSGMPQFAAMIRGFHFIVGTLLALAARPLFVRIQRRPFVLHQASQARLSNISVDVVACTAVGAVQLSVLTTHGLPILLVTTAGGIATLLATLWLTARAFPHAPIEHGILLFGLSTGTLPVGLALLQSVDPTNDSSASYSAIMGSMGAVLIAAPIFIVILPLAVMAWTAGEFTSLGLELGLLFGMLGVLLFVWQRFGPLTWRARRTTGG